MKATRRGFLHGALGLAVAAGLGGCVTTERRAATIGGPLPDDPMNILLVVTDDQGPTLSVYGDPLAHTPSAREFARTAVVFDNAYVTQSSCSASRSSILTGLFPHQNGQVGLSHLGYRMHPAQRSVVHQLSEAGYRTGILGKLHVQPDDHYEFDTDYRAWVMATRDPGFVDEQAGEFLDAANDRPWFLMVNLFDPHRPYLEDDRQGGTPERPFTRDNVDPFGFLAGVRAPEVLEEVAAYYNCQERIDAIFGRLLERLEESGDAEDTLVIFVGDNGPPFTRAKATCYEAGVRVPLVVRWPGARGNGGRSSALVSTVDLVPTMLHAAGMRPDWPVAGQTLSPLLRNMPTYTRKHLFTEMTAHTPWEYYPQRAVRDARFKLIHNLASGRPNPVRGIDDCAAFPAVMEGGGTPFQERVYSAYAHPPEWELYDLLADPNEFHNLAGTDAYAGELKRLQRVLEQWRRATGDPLLDRRELERMNAIHEGLTEVGSLFPGE